MACVECVAEANHDDHQPAASFATDPCHGLLCRRVLLHSCAPVCLFLGMTYTYQCTYTCTYSSMGAATQSCAVPIGRSTLAYSLRRAVLPLFPQEPRQLSQSVRRPVGHSWRRPCQCSHNTQQCTTYTCMATHLLDGNSSTAWSAVCIVLEYVHVYQHQQQPIAQSTQHAPRTPRPGASTGRLDALLLNPMEAVGCPEETRRWPTLRVRWRSLLSIP
jgi:hypothetical protein